MILPFAGAIAAFSSLFTALPPFVSLYIIAIFMISLGVHFVLWLVDELFG